MSTEIMSIDFNTVPKDKLRVGLKVDDELTLNALIDCPPGDRDGWTVGQIKQLAIQSAASKITRQ